MASPPSRVLPRRKKGSLKMLDMLAVLLIRKQR
jgi:hypothetical protein